MLPLSSFYRRIRNVLIGLTLLLTSILTVQLLLNFLVMPRMRIGQVLLESTLSLSDESLLQLGGISGQVNYLTLDEKEVQDSYESSPLIRKAYVQKQFPSTLKIVLYGRSPLGISYLKEDGLDIPVVFDEQGVIFHKGVRNPGSGCPGYIRYPLWCRTGGDVTSGGSCCPFFMI